MIALYKYILEVNAKEEEELFKLKDNTDTKASGHNGLVLHKSWDHRIVWAGRDPQRSLTGRVIFHQTRLL